MMLARMCWLTSEGRKEDSGSLTGTVSAFGAVAPRSMPSSSPPPDRATATVGLDSWLQASLRIMVLMNRSIRPGDSATWTGRGAVAAPADSANPGGSAGWTDACVTWANSPYADRGLCRRGWRCASRLLSYRMPSLLLALAC